MLVHEEIQEIIYWLSQDNSYKDDRDVQSKATEIVMKMPYFVSGFEVDSAANRKLFGKLFALGSQGSESTNTSGLDLLSLKKLVGNSYTLCNFAAQEAMWESA